jgi:acyl-coenzyme A synthetase/AMP-(fatty) acid ligase
MTAPAWRIFEGVAQRRGDAPAIVQGDRRISFQELRRAAIVLAAQMHRRGVRSQDRCLIWSGNSPELGAAMLACWRLGAIIALVDDEAPVTHLAHAAEVTQPALVLVDDAKAEAAAQHLALPLLLLQKAPAESNAVFDLPPQAPSHDLEPASIFFTSGSTGPPKGVTQSHANLIAGCNIVAAHLGLRPDDRILCPTPWWFDYGYGQFLSTVLLGITQVLPLRSTFALCEAIAAHKPTVFAGLPSIFALMLRGVSPIRQTDLSSLRLVTNTGGAIAPAIFDDVRKAFAHCEISLNYGLTETYRSAGLPTALAAERPESVGFAYPGVALAIVRESGEEAEPGEIGEIVHRGAGTFLGYWGMPEKTAAVLRPDPLWRHSGAAAPKVVFTGDLGWKDEDGFLMIKGRRDRQIKSMGVRVSPDEIEKLIRATRLVRDVAVVGVPHDVIGEMVVAAYIPVEGAPSPVRDLKLFARREMSQYMQPREYRLLEAFPLTPNGKTDFAALRRLLTAEAGQGLGAPAPTEAI